MKKTIWILMSMVAGSLLAAGLWWQSIAVPAGSTPMPFPASPQGAQLAGDKRLLAWAQQLQMHLDQQPGDAVRWRLLAQTHMARNDWAQAATAWQRALALDAHHADSHAGWAQTLSAQQQGRLSGRPEAPIATGLKLAPDHPALLALAGELALEQGQREQAVVHLQRLLRVEQAAPDTGDRAARLKAIEQRLESAKAATSAKQP